jgi:hypothetical protein
MNKRRRFKAKAKRIIRRQRILRAQRALRMPPSTTLMFHPDAFSMVWPMPARMQSAYFDK